MARELELPHPLHFTLTGYQADQVLVVSEGHPADWGGFTYLVAPEDQTFQDTRAWLDRRD